MWEPLNTQLKFRNMRELWFQVSSVCHLLAQYLLNLYQECGVYQWIMLLSGRVYPPFREMFFANHWISDLRVFSIIGRIRLLIHRGLFWSVNSYISQRGIKCSDLLGFWIITDCRIQFFEFYQWWKLQKPPYSEEIPLWPSLHSIHSNSGHIRNFIFHRLSFLFTGS